MSRQGKNGSKPVDDARHRLIQAGLEMFGAYNFEGAPTRMLAKRADVNISAIQYYFGGKEGLYRSVARHIVENVREGMEPVFANARSILDSEYVDKQRLISAIQEFLRAIVRNMLQSEWALYASRIILREQMMPTSAFEIIYKGFMEPGNKLLTGLSARLLDKQDQDQEVVLLCFTLIGQVLVFHAGTEAVKRRVGWDELTGERIRMIEELVVSNASSLLLKRQNWD